MANESSGFSDNDRSRSIIEFSDEEPISPISKKLQIKNDLMSKQKLRERLLKRNMAKKKMNNPLANFSYPGKSKISNQSDDDDVFDPMDESLKLLNESSEGENMEKSLIIQSESSEEDETENSLSIQSESSEADSSRKSLKTDESSIICLSSDEDEPKKFSSLESLKTSPESSKENIERIKKPEKLPPHLSKYASDSLETLESKREKMEEMLTKSAGFNLKDGGDSIRQTINNIKEVIKIKSTFGEKILPVGDMPPKSPESIVQYQKRPILISPPKFDPVTYSRLLAQDKKRLFGGKMNDNRLERIKNVTEDALKEMHNIITSMPDEQQLTETPKGIKIELLPHQQHGLAWMLWREKQAAPGGILADDMGLGKTLTTIALILHQKNERIKRIEEGKDENDKKRREVAKSMGLVPSNSTLVVAPASVMNQWKEEIERRLKYERLSVHIFHGNKNKRISDPRRLAKFDVIITTYSLVAVELTEKITTKNNEDDISDLGSDDNNKDNIGEEAKGSKANKKKNRRVLNADSVLAKIAFERVILDEAHQVKNRTTAASKGVCHIPARSHWCLSGTPIHNNLWDMFSLIRFLRVTPFDDEKHWKEYIMGSSQKCADRLNLITKSLLLRRTKSQKCTITEKPLVDLRPKIVKQHELVLEGIEGEIYNIMFRATQLKVKQLLSEAETEKHENLYGYRRKVKNETEDIKNPFNFGNRMINANDKFSSMSSMLVLLLRLRQACVHMHLTKEAIDMEAFEHLGGDDGSADDFLERTMAELTLNEEKETETSIKAEEVFQRSHLSSKLKKLMEIVKSVVDNNEKIVVVSQWTSLLLIVEEHIKKQRINYTSITGTVVISDRQNRVNSFNSENGGPQVMLLSLKAGGDGLNLIGGNHLVMVDLHWNPAVEAQACDRIYRMGQKKTVHIHRLVTVGTIEQRVLDLQEKKVQLAQQVLEGAASKKMNNLSLQDLKFLFEIEDNRKKEVPRFKPADQFAQNPV